MRGIIPISTTAALAAALAITLSPAASTGANAQGAIGFQPTVSPFSDGVFLDTTPVVSADRRHVRLGVDTSFNALRGVQPFSFTAGAVSGGGVGGLGGLGGIGNVGGIGRGVGADSLSSTAVIPGLGAVGPVRGIYGTYGWPGVYYGYPYGYPAPVISGIPAGPLLTGPDLYRATYVPQTINTLQPMGWSIMNSIAPGSWGFPVR